MARVWTFLWWDLVLRDTALRLFYAVKKLDFNNTLIRKADEKLRYVLIIFFVFVQPEAVKVGLLPMPTASSMTLQKKSAIHHLPFMSSTDH